MARPSLLTEEKLAEVREAYALGLSEKEAAEACGLSESTWHSWKAQGRKAQEAIDEKPLASRTVKELRELLRELGVNPDKVEAGGRRKKPSKADYTAAVETRVEPFLRFLEQLQGARSTSKLALLKKAWAIANGGIKTIERKIVTRRYESEDEEDAVIVETTVTEKETLPSWVAVRTLLERRWPEDLGPRRPQDATPPESPADKAKQTADAARAMFATVPGPDVDVDALQSMSDDELQAEFDRLREAGYIS